MVLPQAELTGSTLSASILRVMQDAGRLARMRERSWEMRRIDAAEVIVRECYDLMGVKHDINRTVGATGV
jgi:UDP-N-acetylglucosamine--N-acetylmuramyl-(pentapeptide) pyrophosphoryl-undecaprenol N-acetylglucosamine transferase